MGITAVCSYNTNQKLSNTLCVSITNAFIHLTQLFSGSTVGSLLIHVGQDDCSVSLLLCPKQMPANNEIKEMECTQKG